MAIGTSSSRLQRYLRQGTPEFISPDLWSPNRPDLNLVEQVYEKRVRDVDDLKQRLVEVCQTSGIPQPDVVSYHRRRLRASDTPAPEDSRKLCSQLGLDVYGSVRVAEM